MMLQASVTEGLKNAMENAQLFEVPEEKTVRETRKRSRRQQFLKPPIPGSTVESIWTLWMELFWSGRGAKPRLTPERIELITIAVNEYDVETVKNAVRGCSLSSWHMGQNPSGKRYTSLELILRDSEHIERFQELTVAEDSRGGFLDD
jgi:hypothetical protein